MCQGRLNTLRSNQSSAVEVDLSAEQMREWPRGTWTATEDQTLWQYAAELQVIHGKLVTPEYKVMAQQFPKYTAKSSLVRLKQLISGLPPQDADGMHLLAATRAWSRADDKLLWKAKAEDRMSWTDIGKLFPKSTEDECKAVTRDSVYQRNPKLSKNGHQKRLPYSKTWQKRMLLDLIQLPHGKN